MTTDLDQLVIDCQAALKEVLEREVSRPRGLSPPCLPTTAVRPGPRPRRPHDPADRERAAFLPQDHGSWSACAYDAARERNTFFLRTPEGRERARGRDRDAGVVSLMGAEAVHSIEDPLRTQNAVLHGFAGNPFAAACSQRDPATLEQAPFDTPGVMALDPTPAS